MSPPPAPSRANVGRNFPRLRAAREPPLTVCGGIKPSYNGGDVATAKPIESWKRFFSASLRIRSLLRFASHPFSASLRFAAVLCFASQLPHSPICPNRPPKTQNRRKKPQRKKPVYPPDIFCPAAFFAQSGVCILAPFGCASPQGNKRI